MDLLLELLNEDSRRTAGQLATMMGQTVDEVKNRIDKYEKDGIIKGYKAIINWDKVPNGDSYALIELKVKPKKDRGFDEIAEKVMAFEEVESVYLMAGVYDLAVMVKASTIQDIAMFVSKRLSTLDSVISTATHFLLSRYKESGVALFDNDDNAEKRSLVL